MTDDVPAPPSPTTKLRDRFGGHGPGVAALAVAVVALGLAGAPYLTGGDFGGRVRAYLLANPQVLDEVVQARGDRRTPTWAPHGAIGTSSRTAGREV